MKKNTYFLFLFFCLYHLGYSQNLSQYAFSQSNAGFSAISGGTILGSTTSDDQRFLDPSTPAGGSSFTGVGLPIGFNFNYNGYVYDRFGVNANGWISLGSSLLTPSVDMNTTSSYTPLSSTSTTVSNTLVARISAFTRDLMSQTGGEIRYELQGTSPNQVLVIQWKNYAKYLAVGDSYNFQIKLYQTTNVVEIVYGTMTNNATSTTADCGLRANPNSPATNFSSRTTATDWSATTASTLATNTVLLSNTIFPASGLTFAWTPPSSCSGTPTPGNTISSTASACSGVSFGLSLQNSISGSGVTYQWQTSANGVAYSNASGISTDPTYTTSQTTSTYYQCIVSCTASGMSTTSTPIMIGMNSPLNCYCIPNYTTGKTDGDLISNISISGTNLANNSGTAPTNPAYTYFTGSPNYTGVLQAGSTYNVNVSVGTFGGQNVAVWIDYNDDGIFTTSERVGYSQGSIAGNGSASFSIILACNPPLGTHRMRVRDVWNTSGINIDPCANYGYGETEDYDITISAAVACPQPSGIFTTNVTTTSATLGWTSGCTETSWNVYVTTAGGPAPTTTATYYNVGNPFVVTGLTPGTSYDFYVSADCLTNGTSLWTGAYLFTTAPVNDDCAGALSLMVGNNFASNAITASNVSSTNSAAPAPGCGSYSGGDVWFKVNVPISGNVTIQTGQVTGSPITDTGLAVYSGTCTGLSLVACNDDGVTAFSSISLTGRTPGELLYVLVWKYGGATPYGQFQVSAFDCPSTTPAPTGDATQIFCSAATVGDLYANGTAIKWYSNSTGGTALASNTNLVSGMYYASQTLNCESFSRLAVNVIVSSFPVTTNTSLTACDNGSGVASFNLTSANNSISSETNVTFNYFIDLFDAEANTNAVANPTAFNGTNGQTIFVRVENANGCYSIAELTLNIAATAAPNGNVSQTYCNGTVASLQATGTNIVWYDASTGGNALASTTTLVNGITYYASQNVNGCESLNRLPVTVTVLCYCTPTYTFGTSDGDLISNIQISGTTLANNSGTTAGGSSYTYFTSPPASNTATLQAGNSYTVAVTVGAFGGQNVAVWIDYNDNFIFEASEKVGYTTTSIAGNGTATFNITLSCSPALGLHRMRVRDVWNTNGINIDPCANYGWGETEDYDVTIAAAVACPQPSNLSASNITSNSANLTWNIGCAETAWNLHLTTSGSGAPTGAPSNPSVSSPFVASGLLPSTAYEFYVQADCAGNGTSLWTGPYTFTTAAIPPLNDNCSGAIALTAGGVFADYPVTGTNAAATDSAAPAPGCASYAGGDVWYSVTVPASGNIKIESNPANGSPITDTGMAVYSGNCSNLALVSCDDDTSASGLFSLVSLTGRTPGEVLYVNVWEYGGGTIGQFQVSAYDASLANSTFDNANFTYYPNPVKDVLNLSYSQSITKVQIINLLGQEVILKSVNATESQIDMSRLPSGTYLVKVTSDNQIKTIKVIKQ
ncbi:MAG: T9SS type A sorting domain-containing protein [Flavobacteriaceae bacterium]|nr:T9SS type A sorting domain-containing protein [Flavobacteriaceae bacterium]